MSQCKVCENTHNNITHNVREMMFGTRNIYEYFQCSACNCLQLAGPPKNPSEMYPEEYYSFQVLQDPYGKGLSGYIDRLRSKATISRRNSLADHITRYFLGEYKYYNIIRMLPFQKTTRYLDVGTGNGAFLAPLYNAGYKQCLGIDQFIEHDIEYSSGLQIRKGTIFDLQGEYDVIFYNHSFEHIHEQKAELSKVHELLANQGVCVISIPVFPSLAWDQYGVNWYQIDAPRHYFLHSIESIKYIAELSGFAIQWVIYNSTYAQFYISEIYNNGICMRDKKWHKDCFLVRKYKKIKYSYMANKQNKNRYGDQAVFCLVKK